MVSVRCKIEDFVQNEFAFLDTGAELPMIGGQLAKQLKNRPIEKVDVKMETRFGDFIGNIVRMTITLIADKGESLPIEGSILLAEKWHGPPIVLGYDGFLDRLRFAFDPGLSAPGERIFYFGNEVDSTV